MTKEEILQEIKSQYEKEYPDFDRLSTLNYLLRIENGDKEVVSSLIMFGDEKEIQELDLTRELKRTREQSSLIGLKDIINIMKKVFDSAELEFIRKNI